MDTSSNIHLQKLPYRCGPRRGVDLPSGLRTGKMQKAGGTAVDFLHGGFSHPEGL